MGQGKPGELSEREEDGRGGGGREGQGKAEPRCLKVQSALQVSVMAKLKLGRKEQELKRR